MKQDSIEHVHKSTFIDFLKGHIGLDMEQYGDDISSVAFRSVTFTAKSMDLHLQSEGGD